MFLGYSLILVAASFWGLSAVVAKVLFRGNYSVDPLLISQARVTFGWLILLVWLLVRDRSRLRISLRDFWRFVPHGVIGFAGANFLLYYAVEGMTVAIADLIQCSAPVLVALWMWLRGFEPMDRPKTIALVLAIAGCALALGAFEQTGSLPPIRVASAVISLLCYAFLIVWGKHLSRRYSTATLLHFGLLSAAVFWCFVSPPWRFVHAAVTGPGLPVLAGFSAMSVLIPYGCFFYALKVVPASRASIVGTWEPVMITISAWAILGERMSVLQMVGMVLVIAAIATVEAFPRGENRRDVD